MNYPCKDCQDRHLGCHSDCKRYIECDQQFKEVKEKIYREKANTCALIKLQERKFKNMGTK